jgi:acyl-CoA ligase (AMP-forming) (exosortase A-associated)
MSFLLHHLITRAADAWPERPALAYRSQALSYAELEIAVAAAAAGLRPLIPAKSTRIAIYLEKRIETVVSIFAAAMAGGAFVPVNPVLKPSQVAYILNDCAVRVLITSKARLAALGKELGSCVQLTTVILVDGLPAAGAPAGVELLAWDDITAARPGDGMIEPDMIDIDMAAILYTSGSTGNPKGVVLSHRNLVAGAASVAHYLDNSPEDRILSVLPLSFDAGLSQVTTAFHAGARLVLMNYLLAQDVVRICESEKITGLTAVPPLWVQIAGQDWPLEASRHLRYLANTGGHMPRPLLARLREIFGSARPYLMYGLTEAFRSTYLDPAMVDDKPDSIGKAIPNTEIMVVRPDGQPCAPGEHGELVHRGALVSLGYWGDPARTAERFKPAPGQDRSLPITELAVWSGDIVYRDQDGFLYFVGRNDDMIKTSGYRVSPTEVESVVNGSGLVREAAAIGVPHPALGQAIVVVVTMADGVAFDPKALRKACEPHLPLYMLPGLFAEREQMPRNPNGKIDRGLLKQDYQDSFAAPGEAR